MLTRSSNDRCVIDLCMDQLVTLPVETGRSHLRRGVMGNFRYRSWRQLRPVTTLITVAEHEYVIKNDMYAVFYPYAVAMLRYPSRWITVYGENQNGPLGLKSSCSTQPAC